VVLRDLGTHRLKDLTRPEHIFQVVAPRLPVDFPPLRSLDTRPHNLPAQLTPLIGRAEEVAMVCDRLRRVDVRLLTLTGPGGTGKTRLALQAAAELLDDFTDGVWFVDLAPISDPAMVASTIAQTLGIKETGDQPLAEALCTYLHSKQLLLVLDYFEQVVQAAPLVAELIAAPRLKVLITSRIALHLYGEHEFMVPPLAVPDPVRLPPLDHLSQYDAVRLFIQRAQAVRTDFTVTNDNAPAVAEIRARLDGLPLAIELAAARSKLFAPDALLTRLGNRLKVLVGGARDLPTRQQTLRDTIAWSYQLLNPPEQRLFARLGVFGGGGTLQAAEAICNADGDLEVAVFDGLASLIDKSLLWQAEGLEGEPRFGMLETIREYAREQLEASEDADLLRRQHAVYYLTLAETAEPHFTSGEQLTWLAQLDAEHDNMRAALGWSQSLTGDLEIGLRLAGALWWFWWVRGYTSEGQAWLESVLAQTAQVDLSSAQTHARALALYRAGILAGFQSDHERNTVLGEESLRLFRQLGDSDGIAWAFYTLGLESLHRGNYPQAMARYEESLALFRKREDLRGVAWGLNDLGILAHFTGDFEQATARYEESLALFRGLGDTRDIASSLHNLGIVAHAQGDYEHAKALYGDSLALMEEVGAKDLTGNLLYNLGIPEEAQGNYAGAKARYKAALRLHWEIRYTPQVAVCLALLAGVATVEGQFERVARLFGAAEALDSDFGNWIDANDRAAIERNTARAELGADVFEQAWAAGQAMPVEQAIADALESDQ